MDTNDNNCFDLLDKLVKDIEEKISNAKSNEFNMFLATGMATQEVKHSKFLANLLDPKYPHNLGNSFLKAFLDSLYDYKCVAGLPKNSDILGISKSELLDIANSRHIELFTEKSLTIDEGGRMDICISADNFMVIIENKMFTGTHGEQLRRYEDEFTNYQSKRRIFIYLTPKGDAPVEDGIIRQNWCVMSYEKIVEIINNLIKIQKNNRVKIIMEDYAKMIDLNVLKGNSQLLDACEEVYRNNRDAIELINHYAQTSMENILIKCAELIQKKYPEVTIYSRDGAKGNIYFYTPVMKQYFENPDKCCRCVLGTSDGGASVSGFVEFLKPKGTNWDEVQGKYLRKYNPDKVGQDQFAGLMKRQKILLKQDRGGDIEGLKKKIETNIDSYIKNIRQIEENLKSLQC